MTDFIGGPLYIPKNLLSIPQFRPPVNIVISGNTALTERVNYFRNLTVNAGVTLTGLAGGTIIVVERELKVISTGVITCDALGAKGGPGTTGAGSQGYGGGFAGARARINRTSFGLSIATSTGGVIPTLQLMMANGGDNDGGLGLDGNPAADWPYNASNAVRAATDINLLMLLIDFILNYGADDDVSGSIGGGGGGAGGGGTISSGTVNSGVIGTAGETGSGDADAGTGGSGFGGGGGGGNALLIGGTGGDGGRGGGVLAIICGTLNNDGTISANGADGSSGAGTDAGGGGGGGGGAVCIGYNVLTTVGTLEANLGVGGAPAGGGGAGGDGGNGVATSFKIRSGD